MMDGVTPADRVCLNHGETLPRIMPRISGRIEPTIEPMEMLARPAELRAIMVTVGPTLSEVMATAPLTASSSYWDTIPE